MKGVLTAGQVARKLGVSRVTVWKWRLAGKILAETVLIPGGRIYAYPESEVRRLKTERRKRRLRKTA